MINPIDNAFMIDELCKLFPEFDINTISHTIYRCRAVKPTCITSLTDMRSRYLTVVNNDNKNIAINRYRSVESYDSDLCSPVSPRSAVSTLDCTIALPPVDLLHTLPPQYDSINVTSTASRLPYITVHSGERSSSHDRDIPHLLSELNPVDTGPEFILNEITLDSPPPVPAAQSSAYVNDDDDDDNDDFCIVPPTIMVAYAQYNDVLKRTNATSPVPDHLLKADSASTTTISITTRACPISPISPTTLVVPGAPLQRRSLSDVSIASYMDITEVRRQLLLQRYDEQEMALSILLSEADKENDICAETEANLLELRASVFNDDISEVYEKLLQKNLQLYIDTSLLELYSERMDSLPL